MESLTGFVTAAGIDIVDGTVANSEGVIKLTEIMANDELINSIVTASGLPREIIITELNKLVETN